MEVIMALPVILIPLMFNFIAGWMAQSFGRSFKFWFWISFLLPFISCVILLCLPIKKQKVVKPVDNDHLFDYLFEKEARRYRKLDKV
jgi:hypothetical protein